jgi:hypothetical protein
LDKPSVCNIISDENVQNSFNSTDKNVNVYVNPEDSKDSVLSSGINIGKVMPIILGLLFFLNRISFTKNNTKST